MTIYSQYCPRDRQSAAGLHKSNLFLCCRMNCTTGDGVCFFCFVFFSHKLCCSLIFLSSNMAKIISEQPDVGYESDPSGDIVSDDPCFKQKCKCIGDDIQLFLLIFKFSRLQHIIRKTTSEFAVSSLICGVTPTHRSLENELEKMQNNVKKIKSDFPHWNWYLCHDIKPTGIQKFRKLDVILGNDLGVPHFCDWKRFHVGLISQISLSPLVIFY